MRIDLKRKCCTLGVADAYGRAEYANIRQERFVLIVTDRKPRGGNYFMLRDSGEFNCGCAASLWRWSDSKRWHQGATFISSDCSDPFMLDENIIAALLTDGKTLYGWVEIEDDA